MPRLRAMISNAMYLTAAPGLLLLMNDANISSQSNTPCQIAAYQTTNEISDLNKLICEDLSTFFDEIFIWIKSSIPQLIDEQQSIVKSQYDDGILHTLDNLLVEIKNKYPLLTPLDTPLSNQELITYSCAVNAQCPLLREFIDIFSPLLAKINPA